MVPALYAPLLIYLTLSTAQHSTASYTTNDSIPVLDSLDSSPGNYSGEPESNAIADNLEEFSTLSLDSLASENTTFINGSSPMDVNVTGANTTTAENCSTCNIREEDKKLRIEVIKHLILSKLHFKSPPNMTGRALPKVPSLAHVIERYEMQGDSPYGANNYNYDYNNDDVESTTDRIYTIAKTPPPHRSGNESDVCFFSFPEDVYKSLVKRAYLWFYIKRTKVQKTTVEINILKLGPPLSNESYPVRNLVQYRKYFPEKARGWHRFDIWRIAMKWIRYPDSNYGIKLVALDHKGNNLIVTPVSGDQTSEGYEPMIEMKTTQYHHRSKRSTPLVCPENSTETRCCRYPLRVNFVDFGWDWVIAPSHYKADFCSGECRYQMNDETSHAYMWQMATNSGPCCTPTKLSKLSMLYFDHSHNVLYTNLQKMRVEQCGCA